MSYGAGMLNSSHSTTYLTRTHPTNAKVRLPKDQFEQPLHATATAAPPGPPDPRPGHGPELPAPRIPSRPTQTVTEFRDKTKRALLDLRDHFPHPSCPVPSPKP